MLSQEKRIPRDSGVKFSTRDIQFDIDEMKSSGLYSDKDGHTMHGVSPGGYTVSSPISPRKIDPKAARATPELELSEVPSNEMLKSTVSGKKLGIFMSRGRKSATSSEVYAESKVTSKQNSIQRLINIIEKSTSDIEDSSAASLEHVSHGVAHARPINHKFVKLDDEPDVCQFNANVSIGDIMLTPVNANKDVLNRGMFEPDTISEEILMSIYPVNIEPLEMTCLLERAFKRSNSRFQLGIYNKLSFLDVCKNQRLSSVSLDKPDILGNKQRMSSHLKFINVRPISNDSDWQQNNNSTDHKLEDQIQPENNSNSRSGSQRISENDKKQFLPGSDSKMAKIVIEKNMLLVKFSNVMEAVKNKSNITASETLKTQQIKVSSSKSIRKAPRETSQTSKNWKPPVPSTALSNSKLNMRSTITINQKNEFEFPVQKSQTRHSSKSKRMSFVQVSEVQPFARSEAHCQRLSIGLVPQISFERPSISDSEQRGSSKKINRPLTTFKNHRNLNSMIVPSDRLSEKISPNNRGQMSFTGLVNPVFFGLEISNINNKSMKQARVDMANKIKKTNSISNSKVKLSGNSESPLLRQTRKSAKPLTLKPCNSVEKASAKHQTMEHLAAESSIRKLKSMVKHSPVSKAKTIVNDDSVKRSQLLQLTRTKTPVDAGRPLAQKLFSKLN